MDAREDAADFLVAVDNRNYGAGFDTLGASPTRSLLTTLLTLARFPTISRPISSLPGIGLSLPSARYAITARRSLRTMASKTPAVALLVIGLSLAVTQADAAPAGVALVVGNTDYVDLPPLPGCGPSARAIAAALEDKGYDAAYRTNLAFGQMDAELSKFTSKLVASPSVPAFVYICGYVATFNGRPFLLPVSAGSGRPSDAMAQGLLAKSLVDTVARAGAAAALIVLDAIAQPGPGGPPPLGVLDRPDLPPGLALLGVVEAAGDAPTPLVTTAIPVLKGRTSTIADLLAATQGQLTGMHGATVALVREGRGSALLVGAPPAASPSASPMSAQTGVSPVVTPAGGAGQSVAAPAQVDNSVSPSASGLVLDIPDESRMTAADRRVVQADLARLGYYDDTVDGVFGPETRAGIRRFQHEMREPMTGTLTQDQTRRLLASP